MTNANTIREGLQQFHGTQEYYRYLDLLYTEGIQYLVNEADCYWLLDLVKSWQLNKNVQKEAFQVYELIIDLEKHTGILLVSDGNDNILVTHEIKYTDFPLDKITFWCVDKIILLPSEY